MAKIAIGIVAALVVAAAGTATFVGLPDSLASAISRAEPAANGRSVPSGGAPSAPALLAQAADTPAGAKPPTPSRPLPGGATALSESYQDWTVTCAQQPGDGTGLAGRRCTMNQQQFDARSRQRILAIELAPGPGGLDGVLVLPFGLDLDRGVSLQPDAGEAEPPLHFRTCLPAGCIVPIALGSAEVADLGKGKALRLKAVAAEGGSDALFRISLDGFAAAAARLAALK